MRPGGAAGRPLTLPALLLLLLFFLLQTPTGGAPAMVPPASQGPRPWRPSAPRGLPRVMAAALPQLRGRAGPRGKRDPELPAQLGGKGAPSCLGTLRDLINFLGFGYGNAFRFQEESAQRLRAFLLAECCALFAFFMACQKWYCATFWVLVVLTQEEIHFHETLGCKTMSQHEELQRKQFVFPASASFPILCISLVSSLFTYANFTSV